jgi:zinc/manganese transport system substrate-binding protein
MRAAMIAFSYKELSRLVSINIQSGERMIKFLVCLIAAVFPVLATAEPLRVVTTLSTFASIVEKIGGSQVTVSSIAAAQFNPHFIEARPSDVLRLKRADLFVHGGLDLEVWRGPLVDAAARTEIRRGGERELDLSHGIELLNIPQRELTRAEGDIHLYGNPHYWLTPTNGIVMARAIAGKLAALDPAHAHEYAERLAAFLKVLSTSIEVWNAASRSLRGREVIGYHDEWAYLMTFLGMRMKHFLEFKPGIPPSPRHLAELEEYILEYKVKAILQPTFYSKSAANSLAEKTGAKVVLLCQNVGELPECTDYISMLDYNVRKISEAIR